MPTQLREATIENALKARIGGAGLAIPIRWPNESAPATRPYYQVDFADSAREGGALKGAANIERIEGVIVVTVAVDNDTHTTVANGYADTLVDVFPEGTKINVTGGQITIRMPTIFKGFEANGHWRVPIRIPYTVSRV